MGRIVKCALITAGILIVSGCNFGGELGWTLSGMSKLTAVNSNFNNATSMVATDTHAYVLDVQEYGLPALVKVVDITGSEANIVGTVELVSTNYHGGSKGLVVNGSIVFVPYDYVYAIDVSDPENPSVYGTFGTGNGAFYDLVLSDDTNTLVASPGFRVLDVTDPAAIVELAALPEIGDIYFSMDLAIDGDIVFALDDGNILPVDISDPANPDALEASRYSAAGDFDAITIANGDLYAAYREMNAGLDVLDISDLGSISVKEHLEGSFSWLGGTGFCGTVPEAAGGTAGFVEPPNLFGFYTLPPTGAFPQAIFSYSGGDMVVVAFGTEGIATFSR